ncbi:MAG: T9SS type A sorting domain-containing protein, partial [Bacteroidetes bacterium]|nr:T9SS type A sorting domain-containing protein [Bacteroidota bacterium]
PEPISSGDEITAMDIWPNPARGATTLRYALNRSSPIEVSIFDLLGRRVLEQDDGFRRAGTYSLALETANLVPGTYVVRLRGGTSLRTQMITVIR